MAAAAYPPPKPLGSNAPPTADRLGRIPHREGHVGGRREIDRVQLVRLPRCRMTQRRCSIAARPARRQRRPGRPPHAAHQSHFHSVMILSPFVDTHAQPGACTPSIRRRAQNDNQHIAVGWQLAPARVQPPAHTLASQIHGFQDCALFSCSLGQFGPRADSITMARAANDLRA